VRGGKGKEGRGVKGVNGCPFSWGLCIGQWRRGGKGGGQAGELGFVYTGLVTL